ncbi:type 1 glutamine amidotransferase [Desulfosediminicola sp.]|uniref:type 1 glutamine amidotransferase n=1 Tax=Desulfosediminicola sp. TaxID=2886825 RepID=UPI003AF2A35F
MSTRQQTSSNILVVHHSDEAPCGIFCAELADKGAILNTICPSKGEQIPTSAHHFDGLVVLGGPQHATDDDNWPHFTQLLELMRVFERAQKPVAGICLGCQLLARAHGGEPFQLGFLEFGPIQHQITEAGQADPLFAGINLPPVMEFHEDTFTLPKSGVLLVDGRQCSNQCFKVGQHSYGFQFHLEVDLKQAYQWLELFEHGAIQTYQKYLDDFESQYLKELYTQLPAHFEKSEIFSREIARRWLKLTQQQ